MQATLSWQRELHFTSPDGLSFDGDGQLGTSPMQVLLYAIAGCTAMDVISIMQKKRQKVTSYRVEIAGERGPAGEWPRPFTKIEVNHVFSGDSLDPVAIERAIELSDTKYCSVMATLRQNPEVVSTWEVN